jgi:hypothetical protein
MCDYSSPAAFLPLVQLSALTYLDCSHLNCSLNDALLGEDAGAAAAAAAAASAASVVGIVAQLTGLKRLAMRCGPELAQPAWLQLTGLTSLTRLYVGSGRGHAGYSYEAMNEVCPEVSFLLRYDLCPICIADDSFGQGCVAWLPQVLSWLKPLAAQLQAAQPLPGLCHACRNKHHCALRQTRARAEHDNSL